MNRASRRKRTAAKLIKRAKLFWVLYSSEPDWREMVSKERWAKKLRHGKLYGRSVMNNIEKHRKIKKIREETKELCDTRIIE